MPFDERLADRVREALSDQRKVDEKKMFRGMCFMVNGKMCVCISGDELMCRVGPHGFGEMLEKPGTRPMVHNGKAMSGFVYVAEEGFRSKKDFDFWIRASIAFNKDAKASKKKAPKKKATTKKLATTRTPPKPVKKKTTIKSKPIAKKKRS